MPLPREQQDGLIDRHERDERAARRDTTRDMFRTMGQLAFWVLCGFALFGFAFHTSDHAIGMMFWYAAHAVWIAGVTGSLLAAYRRGERRGDW